MSKEERIVLTINSVLKQRYVIEKVLNSSEQSIVYLATDITLGVLVAIKEYYPSNSCIRQNRQMTILNKELFFEGKEHFLLEARILMKFEQEVIVRCYNYFEENNTAYRVMEYLEGMTLHQYMQIHGKVSIIKTKEIASKIMDALMQIHALGYVYLDVSPDNIMICKEDKVKLIDFSNVSGSHIKTASLRRVTQYQPLEHYKKRTTITPTNDIYALGATIYHMLTGIVPCQADKRSHLTEKYHREVLEKLSYFDETIPDAMEQAVMKSLALQRSQRFQTMQEFKDVFMGYTKLEPTPSQQQYLDRTKKIAYSLIAMGCIVIVGLLTYIYYQKNSGIEAFQVEADTIEVWLPYQSEQEKLNNEEIVDVFKKNYRQITVTLTQINQQEYDQKLKETKELPDVFMNNGNIDTSQVASLKPLYQTIDMEAFYFLSNNQESFTYQVPLAFDAGVYYINTKVDTKATKVTDKTMVQAISHPLFKEDGSASKELFSTGGYPYYYGNSQELLDISKNMQGYWDVLKQDDVTIVLYDFVSVKKTSENKEKASMLFVYELLCDLAQNNRYFQTNSHIPINKVTAKQYFISYPQLSFIDQAVLLEKKR